MNNPKIRDRILRTLYKFNEQHHHQYMSRENLAKELELTIEKVEEEVLTLEYQGYVQITKHGAVYVESARITPAGRLYIEPKLDE
jgi:Mn-dependent DtxR family transcriptional regulator